MQRDLTLSLNGAEFDKEPKWKQVQLTVCPLSCPQFYK